MRRIGTAGLAVVTTAFIIVGMQSESRAFDYPPANCVPTTGGSGPTSACPAPWWSPYTDNTPWNVYIGSDPWGQWIAWQANDGSGACEWDLVDDPGGLGENLMVVGGEADDNIQVVPSSGVTICGFPLSPPIYNGWRIDIEGGIGNDSITAGTGPGNLYAEYSDDLAETNHSRIYTFNSTATLTGADGSDIFYVYSTSPLMYIVGQGGDDFFVMPKVGSNNVEFADGGSGSDRFYGARAVNITGMEWFFGQGVL